MVQDGTRGDSGAPVASLSLANALPRPASEPRTPYRWASALAEMEWAVDLGRDIGSRHWWRGLATLGGLLAVMVAAWPGIRPIEAMAAPANPDDWQEARALTIAPLAMGGDTGRHMAATDSVQPLAFAPERPRIELTATLGQGDSFARLLQRAGVSSGDAGTVASLVSGALPLTAVPEGTRVDIVLGRRAMASAPRPLERIAFRAALDLRLEIARDDGRLHMDSIRIPVDDTPLRIRGRVGDSLYRSARAAGAPPSAIQRYLRTIADSVSVGRDIHADDEYDIVVAHRQAQTGESEVGELMYAGLVQNGRQRLAMLPWTVDGQSGWYDISGVSQQRRGFASPVNGRITSPFGMRVHPILRYSRMHWGIDIGAGYGSPVYAVTDATVTYAGWRGGAGNTVKLDHGGGIGTGYLHLSRIAATVGSRVRRGQIIGYVGSTGLSTGPHLHYELYRNGSAINPQSVNFSTRPLLSGEQLAAFRSRIADMQRLAIGPRHAGSAPTVPARPAPVPATAAVAASATRAGDVIIRPPVATRR